MRIAIFGKAYASDKLSAIKQIFDLLVKHRAEFIIDSEFKHTLDNIGIDLPCCDIFTGNDFHGDIAFSLGGDGTFLKTAERVGNKGIPILGINLGRLGFLADVQEEEIESAIIDIQNGNYHIEDRALLQVTHGYEGSWPYALNEVAVLKLDTSAMITIHAYLNGVFLNTYQADGLLVATPTGSTGYSLSAGGPIVVPQASNFIITPVAPHSLNVRPLVISDNDEIRLTIESRSPYFLISLDGRSQELHSGYSITLRKAPFPIRVIKRNEYTYCDTLRKKLMWGADLRSHL